MTALLVFLLALAQSPVEFGRQEVARALEAAGSDSGSVEIRVAGSGAPESFVLRFDGRKALVDGADANGAMYGALEMAERIERGGARAWEGGEIRREPFLRDRGLNVFLTLPWDYAKNDTDYDPRALVDPQRWWFQNDDYWRTLLDQMARSRLNWLDLHGTWDVSVTDAPNLYAYFIQSEKYPEVGVAPAIKAANLERLNRVIDMAHARGIRVSLMAYEAKIRIPQKRDPPYEESEELAYDYTREVVEKMVRGAPGLDAIGFRIGESGRGGEFFNCYLEAVERSGRDIPLTTRSWTTTKAKVVPLARRSSDFTVEIKYNGEQWGPPYPIAGGRAAGWYSYSFEDYLSDSGPGPAKRTWPGNPTAEGSRWPDQPYKTVWQVRANGTHRIFPFYEPDWVRRTVRTMKIGTASGFTVEPMNAYYPASPSYYLANPATRSADWIHQRDEMYGMLWGRLGYDPDTPEEVFDAALARRFGKAATEIARAWKAASRIVPTAFAAYALGPDHRSHAPELEWGGDTTAFMEREPFDSHVFLSVKEMLALEATGGRDGRLTPLDAAAALGECRTAALQLGRSLAVPEAERPRLEELRVAFAMLGRLASYYEGRLLSAWATAAAESNPEGAKPFRGTAAGGMRDALEAWKGLAESPEASFYKPFTERLRMRTNSFHWKNELPKVEAEAAKAASAGVEGIARTGLAPKALSKTVDARLNWSADGADVVCAVSGKGLTRAWLLAKPLPSATFFHKVPMAGRDGRFEARFLRENCGHAIAAEVEREGRVHRIPSWEKGDPYLVVPSRPGATPPYYNSQEALAYLRPESLDPAKHGLLLLSTRAWDFHRRFDMPAQRKLLDPVARGMTLLLLQQDWTSRRYRLDWLPVKPRVEDRALRIFDPAGALGLPRIETDDILRQPILPTEGWEVFGSGGLARLKHGKGEIWMVQARLMQRMHVPECARALVRLLKVGGTEKPVIVIDAGTEGADYATSVFPDLMNAHDIPFLTLGEVIAAEQGTDCLTPVPGKTWPDAVLGGRGPDSMRIFLEKKVKAAAAKPAPATREEFEKERDGRRKELVRSLGLDPLPPRTPLNARVTGVLRREGYRIEKIVFESRPDFFVTAHLYVPDGREGKKLPVIVNPHGHWRHKKSGPVVQTRAIAQALRGYLALVVDSPGHSFEGDAPIERRGAGPHDDLRLLLGSTNATGIYVWDLMRALDYLETRSDADLSRVGITGASGGGLATVYAFAAEERFACAVPVCYATSLEVNPENGCLCNHVPGTLQVGDRSDVLALRAPRPVFVIGASRDPEFPPEGTRKTGEKLERLYALFDAAGAAEWRIFDSGHDYNKAMREAALGFFDKHLRGVGDGSQVAEPEIRAEPPESKDLVCLPDPPARQTTMRDVARARLAEARPTSFEEVVKLNGGLPERGSLRLEEIGSDNDGARLVAFESEPGLRIPGVLRLPEGKPRGALVLVSEKGKAGAAAEFPLDRLVAAGFACFSIDVRGFGELQGLDPRLMAYLGTADPFAMGWDAARAAEAMLPRSPRVAVIGRGPCGAQVAMFSALLEPRVSFVAGLSGLRDSAECFEEEVPTCSIQPRAASSAPFQHLRSLVAQPALWHFRGEPEPDLEKELTARFAR